MKELKTKLLEENMSKPLWPEVSKNLIRLRQQNHI